MKIGQSTGFQAAFLTYAVMLLAVPISNALVRWGALEGGLRTLVEKGGHFLIAAIVILAIPPVRRAAATMLERPIPRYMRLEVIAAWSLKLIAGFGGIAALALWLMAHEGDMWVGRMTRDVDRQLAAAYTVSGFVVLLLSSTVGPVIEEIVFRGYIYRAFERQWGWVASLMATSALFGIYHPHFWSAFTGSVIMVCVLRRTGSLRAPILVHMGFNFVLWPPFLGHLVFPRAETITEPSSWLVHGTCLAVAVVAVPAYVYMSRDRAPAPTVLMEPHGALQK